MIYRTMNDGNRIPALGFGTFQMTSAEVHKHLDQAIELGIRHIDTANRYFNEVAVGEVIRCCDVSPLNERAFCPRWGMSGPDVPGKAFITALTGTKHPLNPRRDKMPAQSHRLGGARRPDRVGE